MRFVNADHLERKTHMGQRPQLASLPALQVLDAPQALELAVDHDGHPRAQGLALLHAAERREVSVRTPTQPGEEGGAGPEQKGGGMLASSHAILRDTVSWMYHFCVRAFLNDRQKNTLSWILLVLVYCMCMGENHRVVCLQWWAP